MFRFCLMAVNSRLCQRAHHDRGQQHHTGIAEVRLHAKSAPCNLFVLLMFRAILSSATPKALQMPRTAPAPSAPFSLAQARVHEAEGRGRHSFALFQATRHPGAVIWILPDHQMQRLMPRGLSQDLAKRLILLTPSSQTDLLWCLEESLRTRSAGLVIAEPEKPLSLTAGRRLQLAAEAGRTTGLVLLRDMAGSNATETRWQCNPAPSSDADSTLHHWSLIKNKKGTLGFWMVQWNGTAAAVDMVCKTGQRCEPSASPL
jgi:protein ImuA